mgnify:CR=1 FL=1|tara:strand:- start:724 stop:1569 length:846 start_codon:yes stop_codon:yes gene_type:complete
MDDDEYFKELLEKACRTLDDVAEDVRNNLSSAVKNIIKAGKALQEGRDLHTSNITFHEWCEEEFPELKPRIRLNIMQVGKRFDTQFIAGHLPLTVLYELAAPSVPDELVKEFMSSEKPVKVKDVKSAKAGYKKVKEDESNSDLLEAVAGGFMKPTAAANEALSRAKKLQKEFNDLTEEEKIASLGGEKSLDAAHQRQLDETLEDDFNPNNAANSVLISISRIDISGGYDAIEYCIMQELRKSPRMQKYEAAALLNLANVINNNYNEIAGMVDSQPTLKIVN